MLERTSGRPLARDAMAYVLAGGRGSRLMEMTDTRAKPAVYFGGKARIIDFALSNAINSGIRRIGVATQYKAHSLIRHLQRGIKVDVLNDDPAPRRGQTLCDGSPDARACAGDKGGLAVKTNMHVMFLG